MDLGEGLEGPFPPFSGEFYNLKIYKKNTEINIPMLFSAPSFQNWDPRPHFLNFLDLPL